MPTNASKQRLITLPAGYPPHSALWVWALQDTRARTIEAVAGASTSVINWRPPEGDNRIGMLLYHLLAIEMSYLYEDILQVGWSDELAPLLIYGVRDEQGQLAAVQGENLATHLERLEAGRALLLNALQTLDEAEFRRPRQVEDYVTTPEWVLHHLMQHEAEHRGQIMALRHRAE